MAVSWIQRLCFFFQAEDGIRDLAVTGVQTRALPIYCVFIDTGKERILIETGIGEKWDEKASAIYGIERERPLAESLKEITGCGPDEITIVANTHLHFDHAGGNTNTGQQSTVSSQFKNARYIVSRSEFDEAENPHERERASYLPENWRPILESG